MTSQLKRVGVPINKLDSFIQEVHKAGYNELPKPKFHENLRLTGEKTAILKDFEFRSLDMEISGLEWTRRITLSEIPDEWAQLISLSSPIPEKIFYVDAIIFSNHPTVYALLSSAFPTNLVRQVNPEIASKETEPLDVRIPNIALISNAMDHLCFVQRETMRKYPISKSDLVLYENSGMVSDRLEYVLDGLLHGLDPSFIDEIYRKADGITAYISECKSKFNEAVQKVAQDRSIVGLVEIYSASTKQEDQQ